MKKVKEFLPLLIPISYIIFGGIMFGTAIVPTSPQMAPIPKYIAFAMFAGSLLIVYGAVMMKIMIQGHPKAPVRSWKL